MTCVRMLQQRSRCPIGGIIRRLGGPFGSVRTIRAETVYQNKYYTRAREVSGAVLTSTRHPLFQSLDSVFLRTEPKGIAAPIKSSRVISAGQICRRTMPVNSAHSTLAGQEPLPCMLIERTNRGNGIQSEAISWKNKNPKKKRSGSPYNPDPWPQFPGKRCAAGSR
jgi:hypothetical protein